MSESETISVNFGNPMPIFPLEKVTLMPHALLPVHIFEPRYRSMIRDALDGPGQIAMAVFARPDWRADYEGKPPVRPAVCVGQIAQHNKLPDGRYNVLLQGVCRARILRELDGDEIEKPYRMAVLEPVGVESAEGGGEERLAGERSGLAQLFSETRLSDFREAPTVIKHLADEEIPTSAILELVTFSFLPDPELRYRLLAEADPLERSRMIRTELHGLRKLLDQAAPQRVAQAPKGVSHN